MVGQIPRRERRAAASLMEIRNSRRQGNVTVEATSVTGTGGKVGRTGQHATMNN